MSEQDFCVACAHSTCPRCGEVILWCDGLPAPELVYDHGVVVACARCVARRRAPAEPVRRSPPPATPARSPRQILAEEGPEVVSILNDGLDIFERVASLFSKLRTPKR